MWQMVGHHRAILLLQRSIETQRISHAYLFSGPRQIGKYTLALQLAKALNCQEADRPCGRCRSCRKIDKGIHPDVQAIYLEEGSKNIGIDAVRKLQEGVALKPAEGYAKVYIFRDAERLSEPAANALLKTLEEPPRSVVLVLTTADASMLLPTIVSRCQQLELRPVATAEIEQALGERAVPPEQAKLLATLARGRVGWALETASHPARLEKRKELFCRLATLPTADRVSRFAFAAEVATLHGRDPEAARGILESWQSWWRDLLLKRLGLDELVVNVDHQEQLGAQSSGYSVETLSRMVGTIQGTISMLSQNVNARLSLETLMLSVPRGGR